PDSQKRPAPRGFAAYPRKRAVTACQVCRARRTKCDNLKPSCSFCLKVGAKCIQSSVDLSSYDPASLQILQRLDDLEQLVRDIGGGQNVVQAPTEGIPKRESFDRSRLTPCSIDQILDWSSLKSLRGQRQPNEHAFPCTNSAVVQMTTTSPMSGHDELEPHRTRRLVDNFFNYVHVKNPVLDEQGTRQIVSRVCMHGIDWSPEACLTLLVCALGTIATPLLGCSYVVRDSDTYRTAESFFLASKKRLGMLLGSSSLIEAQCMFLAGVYTMCTFQRLPAWRFFMQSLACCQTFESLKAFRQDYGEQLDEDGRRSAAAEQAIYWSAWKSEREIHHELGLPGYLFSEIDITGYPPFYPTPPRHEDQPPSIISPDTERREHASWYFYLSEISLLRLRRRMAREIQDIEPHNSNDLVTDLTKLVADHERQILDWINALPEHLSINAPPEEDEICRFVLRGHLIDVYEMLYWPFVDRGINGPASCDDDPLLAELATKGLRYHVERIIVNRPGFQHRHHGTFGMIVSCTRSALVLLA
ncbi:C6 zinc finger domain-containing protein, partial [Trematosphaeria pertusa]